MQTPRSIPENKNSLRLFFCTALYTEKSVKSEKNGNGFGFQDERENATTKGDTGRFHKVRQARLINAKVVDVTVPISNKSTSKLVSVLNKL